MRFKYSLKTPCILGWMCSNFSDIHLHTASSPMSNYTVAVCCLITYITLQLHLQSFFFFRTKVPTDSDTKQSIPPSIVNRLSGVGSCTYSDTKTKIISIKASNIVEADSGRHQHFKQELLKLCWKRLKRLGALLRAARAFQSQETPQQTARSVCSCTLQGWSFPCVEK